MKDHITLEMFQNPERWTIGHWGLIVFDFVVFAFVLAMMVHRDEQDSAEMFEHYGD